MLRVVGSKNTDPPDAKSTNLGSLYFSSNFQYANRGLGGLILAKSVSATFLKFLNWNYVLVLFHHLNSLMYPVNLSSDVLIMLEFPKLISVKLNISLNKGTNEVVPIFKGSPSR
jgi:hypothetical protein